MIVASLLLILLAVVLLVIGLAGGSSLLLIISIAASLLAAVALVAGARQVAAARATAEPVRPRGGPDTTGAYGPPVDTGVPVQHVPPTVDDGGAGWRQPPEPPAADPSTPVEPFDDEPATQDVPVADAARLARLDNEVRVVDGRPRYHLPGCPHLVGREHEPLPVAEAVELGFTPCVHCTPATALLAEDGRITSGGAGA
ncbi:hypothetical protein [Micromonospora thermarum]|uniref:Uncharacterized protein n=1 Tax=Micromonospora thermarum TaxID=2720024 RepID=A0ABX0ZBF2_9ACTN|nr:hypothetical protein [Micromonospora thermarum]NJP35245.1 hypothetical protein [Micromonospora thermarum]